MKRLLASGAAVAATLVLAACGGGSGSSTSSSSTSGTAVNVKSIDGKSNVLVDADGKALYSSNVEANGKIMCTDGCTSFWKPLTTDTAKPAASPDAGKVGVIKRPDGSMQVAIAGKPLYTFAEDSRGKIKGDGFTDDFSGRHFIWHTALAGAKVSSGGSSSGSGDSGSGAPQQNDFGY